ncbi:coiled-coil structural protein [Mycobacterium tuberculosis]|nr:coiled-coil structural protein [Mycobacterium tuberculosis]CRF28531.1 coiled-coil structural protein [Mycobacterium tuberculosis]
MTTAHNGSAPRFQRTRSGYDPVAVNHYIAELVLRQLNRPGESGDSLI